MPFWCGIGIIHRFALFDGFVYLVCGCFGLWFFRMGFGLVADVVWVIWVYCCGGFWRFCGLISWFLGLGFNLMVFGGFGLIWVFGFCGCCGV